jgi:hypothetical protein
VSQPSLVVDKVGHTPDSELAGHRKAHPPAPRSGV